MPTGKLKWFNYKKGFGFIVSDEDGKDVFLHMSALRRANIRRIEEGQAVSYTLQEEKGKICATDLTIL